MTYFSQALLRHDTQEARDYTRKALNDTRKDSGHSLIWTLFSKTPETKRDFLFRTSGDGSYLIVSHDEPCFDARVWEIRSRLYDPRLEKGQRYGFSLKVNPTIDVSQPDRARSKRVDVVLHARKNSQEKFSIEDCERLVLDWLEKKMEKSGAILEKNLCLMKEYGQLQIERKGSQNKASLSVASIDGVLTVSDADRLQQALFCGIGRGKAFGLGLLLLRPLAAASEE